MNHFQKTILWGVKILLFAIPFLPIFISPALLFPFITGKNFTFRILIELAFALWVGLALSRAEFRPQLTPLFKAITIFTVIVFLADLFSPNPYRSFFSNFERMEGFMMIGHLYLYFLMLSSVFRKRDWLIFFHLTLLASLIVSWNGFLQKLGYKISLQGGFRVDSTIGNPTYLAAYLVFNIWILFLLGYTFKKTWWAVALYGAAALFELAIVYFTATRGAAVALVATFVMLATVLVLWWPRIFPLPQKGIGRWPAGKKIAAGVLALAVLVPLGMYLAKDTSLVSSNQVLRRLTKFSFTEDTIQARFRIWRMSARGAFERPFLGWGQENYYLVFQKYFDPALYSQEPWFDRSHNVILDWLIHAGVPGLTAYMAVLGVAFWGLLRGMKLFGSTDSSEAGVPVWHGFVLIAAFTAHIIQNIFVFDNLNTYIMFYGLLAYSLFLIGAHSIPSQHSVPPVSPMSVSRRGTGRTDSRMYAALIGMMVVTILFGYYVNIRPIRQSKALVGGLMIYQGKGKMDDLIGAFRQALSYDTFGNTEVREQIANLALSIWNAEHYSGEDRKKFVEFALEELRNETAHPAKDVKHMLFRGAILNRALSLDPVYRAEAEQVFNEAYALSPTKQVLLFEIAQFYMLAGNQQKAAEVVREAWLLDTNYHEALAHYWTFAVLIKNQDMLKEVATEESLKRLKEDALYRVGEAYRQVSDYQSALIIYSQLVHVASSNPKYRASLAALLANAGRIGEAREQALEAARLDPSFKGEADLFLKQIETKQ